MAAKIRLGWEARLDQLTIAVDLAVVGVGLLVWGAYVGSVLMIVPGALVALVALVRLHGWRSLLWPRTLTIGPDGIADDTRKGTAFHVRWPDVHSVGVITTTDAMTLVFALAGATRAEAELTGSSAGSGAGTDAGTAVPGATGLEATGLGSAVPDATGLEATGSRPTGPEAAGPEAAGPEATGLGAAGPQVTGLAATGLGSTGLGSTGLGSTGLGSTGLGPAELRDGSGLTGPGGDGAHAGLTGLGVGSTGSEPTGSAAGLGAAGLEATGPEAAGLEAAEPWTGLVRLYRIPRRAAVLPALRAAAPCPVTELPPGERVVVDVGSGVGRQGVVGGLVAGFFGAVGLVGAFSPGTATWARVVAGLIGTPLTLVALGTLLSLPVLLRKRQVVLDPLGFSWVDPGGQSFTIPWTGLRGVSVESTVVRNYRSGNRYAVRVVLSPAESHPELAKFAAAGETYELRLGSLPRQGAVIADAVAHLAPDVWRGSTEKPGRFGLT
ncbi:hypothetical protein GCM10029964_048410 [Kibdelosporangium lantanae]